MKTQLLTLTLKSSRRKREMEGEGKKWLINPNQTTSCPFQIYLGDEMLDLPLIGGCNI